MPLILIAALIIMHAPMWRTQHGLYVLLQVYYLDGHKHDQRVIAEKRSQTEAKRDPARLIWAAVSAAML